jgi:hypothetical protein
MPVPVVSRKHSLWNNVDRNKPRAERPNHILLQGTRSGIAKLDRI